MNLRKWGCPLLPPFRHMEGFRGALCLRTVEEAWVLRLCVCRALSMSVGCGHVWGEVRDSANGEQLSLHTFHTVVLQYILIHYCLSFQKWACVHELLVQIKNKTENHLEKNTNIGQPLSSAQTSVWPTWPNGPWDPGKQGGGQLHCGTTHSRGARFGRTWGMSSWSVCFPYSVPGSG